jgi:hypothetical protein
LASSDQTSQWLILLTLNLLVMSSILMQELMEEGLNTAQEQYTGEVEKHGKTSTRRRMGTT